MQKLYYSDGFCYENDIKVHPSQYRDGVEGGVIQGKQGVGSGLASSRHQTLDSFEMTL